MGLWNLLGLGALLVASNVYWWRRSRVVRRSLVASERWDRAHADWITRGSVQTGVAAADGRPDRGTVESADSETSGDGEQVSDSILLSRATDAASVPAEQLPERIEKYNEQVGELRTELEKVRARWAKTWWNTLDRIFDTDGEFVVTLHLQRGTTDEARELAKRATNREGVVAFVSTGDGSFAVGVGDGTATELSASELVADITDRAGGGGGGSDQLATGGGSDSEELKSAIETAVASLPDRVSRVTVAQ